jgi:hypothetical protein
MQNYRTPPQLPNLTSLTTARNVLLGCVSYLCLPVVEHDCEEKHENNKLKRPSTGIPIRTLFQRLEPAHRDNYKLKG